MFSGGLNMKWLPTLTPAQGRELVETFSGTMMRVWSLPIPTVAAVTGHAVAGGCVLASACDQRFALDGPYRIQMNEVLVGMAMPTWASLICQSAFPVPRSNEMLLLGRPFSPQEAHAIGVLQDLAADEDGLLAMARAAARALTAVGPRPYAITKARLRSAAVEHAKQVLFTE
jgi:enoyl-CoA hydratase